MADRHGGLKRGDQLLSVNGVSLKMTMMMIILIMTMTRKMILVTNMTIMMQVSVEGEPHEKAVELLKAALSSVKLVVRSVTTHHDDDDDNQGDDDVAGTRDIPQVHTKGSGGDGVAV